jgi:hypothetical protein
MACIVERTIGALLNASRAYCICNSTAKEVSIELNVDL